jgi:hypothetical protein
LQWHMERRQGENRIGQSRQRDLSGLPFAGLRSFPEQPLGE